ncbi:MAG TPA: FAD-dependent oxidoreductase, partial [Marmoricola sp.]|nr:FAD-dependent oxidoreductase [Marmoricola sp.]
MSSSCDVVVVGLGPGGEALATELAGAGLDVVAVDQRLVGGECPYFGCVPTKMMVHAATPLAEARRLPGGAEVRPDWGAVARRIREEATDDWDDTVAVKRLEDAGVRFVRGHGRLAGPGRVEVDGSTYDARTGVVLNTGTEPAVPPVDGLAGTPYWTNRDAVQVTTLPASLVVIGGGAIGCELAQVFARFGVEVTVVEVADRLLAVEEPEASRLVADAFAEDGIQVRTDAEIRAVQHAEGTFTVDLGDQQLSVDR